MGAWMASPCTYPKPNQDQVTEGLIDTFFLKNARRRYLDPFIPRIDVHKRKSCQIHNKYGVMVHTYVTLSLDRRFL